MEFEALIDLKDNLVDDRILSMLMQDLNMFHAWIAIDYIDRITYLLVVVAAVEHTWLAVVVVDVVDDDDVNASYTTRKKFEREYLLVLIFIMILLELEYMETSLLLNMIMISI